MELHPLWLVQLYRKPAGRFTELPPPASQPVKTVWDRGARSRLELRLDDDSNIQSAARMSRRQQNLLNHLRPQTAAADWWVAPPGAPQNVLDQFDMTGKVALITGGTGWLGSAFAAALAEVGATVVVSSTSLERAAAAALFPTRE